MRSNGLKARNSSRTDRAFTLIELLVVVSIISLLIGILLPTLGTALSEARTTVCGTTQRGLGQGLALWSTENRDQIPGVNTTWVEATRSGDVARYMNEFASAPVQNWDWMSAALSGEDLPTNRNQRFLALLERYRCPENRVENSGDVFGSGEGATALQDMIDRSGQRDYGTSYLMSAYFQTTGGETRVTGTFPNQYVSSYGALYDNPVTVPETYTPRVALVGNPATKAAITDGFRYFDDTTGRTNLDGDYDPRFYGAFAHSTPTFSGSREFVFGRQFSYRHNGRINNAYFDGHVDRIDEKESRNPRYWFPTGSVFTGQQAHPDAESFYQPGDVID